MKKPVFAISFAVLLGVLLLTARIHSKSPKTQADEHSKTPYSATGKDAKRLDNDLGDTATPTQPATPSEARQHGSFSIWSSEGNVDAAVAQRYKLTSEQLSALRSLYTRALHRLARMERENGRLLISPDRQQVTINTKGNAEAAREFDRFYQDALKGILGDAVYADYREHSQGPFVDEFTYGGAIDKEVTGNERLRQQA
jgi:hypothetical protein